MGLKKLPEKWYIIRDANNYEVLNKWNNETYPNTIQATANNTVYFYSDTDYKLTYYPGYTQITFEEFIKYVLYKNEESVIQNYDYLIKMFTKFNIQ
jgi:hypothetical protein